MNGQEHDDEIFKGAMGAEYWEYDSRIGRRWNIDPIVDESISPYACFANNPILMNDPDGLEAKPQTGMSRFWAKVRHPFNKRKQHEHLADNNHGRHKGETGKHWSVGEVFMKIVGALRGGSHYHLPLIPQGQWGNTNLQFAGSGILGSGQSSGPISITTPPGQYKRKVSQIGLLIDNPFDDGPPGGYLRVTGIYRHGKDRAKYRTMFTNTGGTGFGIGDGGDESTGWMGGGHSGFLTSIPQWFKEIAMQTGGFGKDNGNAIIAGALAVDALNNRVFSPFRNASALRVENTFSLKPVGYQLYLMYRQWNWIAPGSRKGLWKRLHDVTGNKGAGF
jgi:RHS repeat-associated protein